MNTLTPYLVFSGNCKEAMEFYATVLNGEITLMQTFDEAPMPFPESAKNRIFNSEMRAGNIIIKASDNLPDYPVESGTNISLFIHFENIEEKKHAFKELAKEGKVLFPLEENFGMLKDKYGIQWMVIHEH